MLPIFGSCYIAQLYYEYKDTQTTFHIRNQLTIHELGLEKLYEKPRRIPVLKNADAKTVESSCMQVLARFPYKNSFPCISIYLER